MAMSMAMQRRKSGGSSIGESLDLMFGRLGIGAQGKEYKLSRKEQKAKTEHTKAVADYIREQTELMADEEVKRLNRQLKNNEVLLGKENIKAAQDKMALLENLKGGTPEERELYVDTVLGGVMTKKEREDNRRQIALLQSQSQMFRDALSSMGVKLNIEQFLHRKDREALDDERSEANWASKLFQGPIADRLKVELGDDAFRKIQEEAVTSITDVKLRRTPHDYGITRVRKQPGDLLTFATAYKYWKNGNIIDTAFWQDWGDELTELGYRLDSTGKIKISPEDESKLTPAMINNAGRRKSVRDLTNTALDELEKAKKKKEANETETKPQSKDIEPKAPSSHPPKDKSYTGFTVMQDGTNIKWVWDGTKWQRAK